LATETRAGTGALPAPIPLEQARAEMLAGLQPLPVEEVGLADALGRVLAEPIDSQLRLPPWDNSAMDGFAVRSADTLGAAPMSPVELPVSGEVAAGVLADRPLEPGCAMRILTGAPLPDGADAVVPVEATDAPIGAGAGSPPERVAIFEPAAVGDHVRPVGSDLLPGARLLEPGRALAPAALALAAAGGHARLPVFGRPRVAVLSTGDELVAPGQPLGPAQIPDSNSIGLLAQTAEAGAETRSLGVAADRRADVLARLAEALPWADIVVVSGGVSVGAHDVVKDAFAELGTLELWRVAVQPGKPLAFGRAARRGNGRSPETLLFGLPGNPVSSFVTFELFVRPVLRTLAGHADPIGREMVQARLSEPIRKSPGRRAFLRVRLEARPGATPAWSATLAGAQASHVLSALAAADGLAIVPEEHESLPAGAEVEVIRL